ncbi:MAG: M15 family metallopeptidase [Prosthecobacter sp.]
MIPHSRPPSGSTPSLLRATAWMVPLGGACACVLLLTVCSGGGGRVSRSGDGTLILNETTNSITSSKLGRKRGASGADMPKTLQPGRTLALAREFDLVDVRAAIPDLSIDLRYATADNVARRPLYDKRLPCMLRRETADKLRHAQAILRAQGYGIRLWDAYRPPEVQEILFQAGASTHMFLSPETTGWSRHCGGIAVDVTLVDAAGQERRMPTRFDAGLQNAAAHYQGSDLEIRRNLQILQAAMKQAGFTQVTAEWWHFDDGDFVQNPQSIIYAHQLAIPKI